MTLTERAKKIRLLILDIDGVMTDGSINTSGSGELFKRFYVRDGLGIKMLQKAGIEVAYHHWQNFQYCGGTLSRTRHYSSCTRSTF